MSILGRISQILKANVNDALDKAEDPAKMIEQTLRELHENLAEVKQETAGVIADEKAAERRFLDCKKDIEKAELAAKNALIAGNDGDAKIILARKSELMAALENHETVYKQAHENSEKMRTAHDKLVSDIESLENRKDAIKAKMAVAKTQDRINKMTGADKAAGTIEAFNRWEAKANKRLDSARAAEDLNKNDDASSLANQYVSGTGVSVDEELAKMKAELGLEGAGK